MNTDALHKLNNVTGKRSGLAAVQYCIEHGIYCGGNGGDDGAPAPPPPPQHGGWVGWIWQKGDEKFFFVNRKQD